MITRHDDMLGEIRSAVSGGTQWASTAMRDTSFVLGSLINNSTDYFQAKIQCTHRRKRNSNLDSIHLHWCCGSQAVTLNETIVWTGCKYAWIKPGDVFPADADWVSLGTAGTVTWTLPAMPAWTYAITSFGTGLSIPAGWSGDEGYGSMLLFKATRGNGTYTTTAPNQINSAVHIIDCDAHSPMDRLGSINEASD